MNNMLKCSRYRLPFYNSVKLFARRMRYHLRSRKYFLEGESLSNNAKSTNGKEEKENPAHASPNMSRTRIHSKRPSRMLRRRHSSNAFRTAEVDDLEGILLFKEKPRQFLFLFLVIAAVSYYSITHDSHVSLLMALCLLLPSIPHQYSRFLSKTSEVRLFLQALYF